MSKHLSFIDLNRNELRNALAQVLGTAPSTPPPGMFYFDSVIGALMVRNASGWVAADPSKAGAGTIPNTALATNPLARANHTGNQVASTISDLASVVKAYRLDEFAVPTAAVNLNSQLITNLATPTTAGHAAEYSWVVSQLQQSSAGIDSKPSVRVLSNSNITLSGTQTIDSVALSANDRVLVRGQTTASANGPYTVQAGAWVRAVDGDQTGELTPGAFWFVEEGTVFGKTQWRIENTGAITVGTTSITINQFGAAAGYTAGNGIDIIGSAISVVPASGGGLAVGVGGVSVDTAVVTRKYSANIGDNASTSIAVVHNLGTKDVTFAVRQNSDDAYVECDAVATSTTTTTLTFSVAPASNALRVTVHA